MNLNCDTLEFEPIDKFKLFKLYETEHSHTWTCLELINADAFVHARRINYEM